MGRLWHSLGLGTSADVHLPPLLVSTAFEADSYTVHLTDLTYIWVESLDHAAILERAEEENTSIDPTDSSQLHILLSKLGLALSSGPKTKLNLKVDLHSGRVRPAITLNLAIELPGGLAPLQWPIHLAAAPQSLLTNQLTKPLLHAQHARMKELESLKEVVKEKDHVIQKLMDKIEAQGIDLGQVFPQATAKGGRKVDRARAEEKVHGLRQFDSEAANVQHVLSEDIDLKIESVVGEENWWDNIQSVPVEISKDNACGTRTISKAALKHQESTQYSDAFQVQSSPTYRASKAPQFSQSIALDDSTDDDEDLGPPSQRSKTSDSFPSLKMLASDSLSRPGKKLGKIGGKKETPKKPLPPPAAENSTDDEQAQVSKPARQSSKIGGKRKPSPTKDDSTDDEEPAPKSPNPPKAASPPSHADDETTDDEDAPIPRQQSPTQSPKLSPATAPPKPKGKIGKRGGKKENPPPTSSSPSPIEASKAKRGKLGQIGGRKKEATPPPPASEHEATASQTPAKRKLGVIGGRNKTALEENSVVEEDETRGRSVKPEKEETPPPREASKERAEKKRRELKRELEAKAKAPVKKKRKF
jgi:hypothetical protein